MIKKVFIYIIAMIALAACSKGELAEFATGDITPTTPEKETEKEITGLNISVSEPIYEEAITTSRSVLSYLSGAKQMYFTWESNDKFGIYALKDNSSQDIAEDKSTVQALELKGGSLSSSNTEESSTSTYRWENIISDAKINMTPQYTYGAYYPYNSSYTGEGTNYTNVPLDYTGQIQKDNSKMSLLYNYSYNGKKQEDLDNYHASERAASAHLSAYDYMTSNATMTNGGGIHFYMNRKSATVRLYLLAPKLEVFDEIQILNLKHEFATKTTMNVKDQTLAAEPTEKSHVISLKLDNENHGFDFVTAREFDNTHEGNDTHTASGCKCEYFYNRTGYGHLIIAYLMVAPIDLSDGTSTLYLIGRKTNAADAEKTYYKATLSAKDLKANVMYQWSYKPEVEEPITFEAISIEQWKSETTINNGTTGTGTATW